ncbi:glycerophosphodiester phosphodiesterase family protein [Pedobacter sp. SL55]|uniref:glycerophosphodiester phosphodiesterase family protein n=1 Tax=Pedobacter sp. SL55 TaxID=2995161 RepID=UPI002270A33B|nr:glycerophosphodiester phosphodiesterase family protein [Pedobacter sp. SL55]WAC40847.1 glycerophosphodiester phosphodiesterase family protein [Pedobacter sp. SL55]
MKFSINKLLLLLSCWCSFEAFAQKKEINVLKFKDVKELKAFFKHGKNNFPIISGHRGGMTKGFPENSMETFANTLKYMPSFFEIDPRLTKDSVAVLMHDATLERTTNGKGKLSDYTYAELQKLRLKDPEGNVTDAKIPTLKEAILWSKGRTVMNLDKKDVPLEITARILKECNNEAVMLTVHNAKQARFYLDQNPNWMLSVHIKTKKAYDEYVKANIPWESIIAYIGPEYTPENKELMKLLQDKGVMVMISSAPTYDKLATPEERAKAYIDVFKGGADILESDLPVEVANAIKNSVPKKTPQHKYLGKEKI